MNDPLLDPRSHDLIGAQPDQIDALRRQYDLAAGNAQYIARGMRAAGRSPGWSGKAAQQFHDTIGHVPHQLDLVTNSYWEVADALRAYGPLVGELQAQFTAALGPDYRAIAGQLSQAYAAQTQDAQTLSRLAAPGSTATEVQIRRARDAFDRDVRTVTTLEGEVGSHSRRAFEVLDDFETARARAAHQIALAATIAIKPVTAPTQPPVASATTAILTGAPLVATGAPTVAMTAAGERVQAMIAYANQTMGTPYVSGGGHGAFTVSPNGGLDCSGFVSGVLHSGGYLDAPQTTETLASQPGIVDGPGRYVTIYDRTDCGDNEHVIIDINGQFYEEGGGTADGGAADVHAFTPSTEYLQSFNRILHPVGL
jgi:cell wall-associated NlpC family hydrolase